MNDPEKPPVTMEELEALKRQTADERLELAHRVGQYLKTSDSEADRRAAFEISRVLASDASDAVRKALCEEIRFCDFLPADLIDRIIADIDAVSAHFVAKSQLLDEERLIKLVRLGGDAMHLAIADRESVSEPVSYALCEVAKEPAVSRLMANEGAEVSRRAYFLVVERFPESETLMEAMSRRGDLPLEAAEMLLERLAETAANLLVKRYNLAPDFASYISGSARRRVLGATLETAPMATLETYMRQLKAQGELNSDIMLHLIRNGNLRSFIAGIAVLSDTSSSQVRRDLDEQGASAILRLLGGAGFGRTTVTMMATAYQDTRLSYED